MTMKTIMAISTTTILAPPMIPLVTNDHTLPVSIPPPSILPRPLLVSITHTQNDLINSSMDFELFPHMAGYYL